MIGASAPLVADGSVLTPDLAMATQTGLLSELAGGPLTQDVGEGVRHGSGESTAISWLSRERAIWPVRGSASSTYGSAWSPNVLIGPPRVFPRSGDIAGAWAPQPRTSPVEWIECEYAVEVPVSAIRVFETHQAGSTFAIVDLTDGATLVWAAGPRSAHGAQVLEIAVSPPRVIRKLRVYMTNAGWTEIDTVGLVAASPLPAALRSQANTLMEPARRGGTTAVGIGLALVAAVTGAAVLAARSSPTRVPAGIVGLDWHANVTTYRGANGAALTVRCAPGGEPGSVWGSNVYSDDSSVCTAAVHAGRINFATGGVVSVELQPGQDHYDAITRNGVTSQSYGHWSGSFVIR